MDKLYSTDVNAHVACELELTEINCSVCGFCKRALDVKNVDETTVSNICGTNTDANIDAPVSADHAVNCSVAETVVILKRAHVNGLQVDDVSPVLETLNIIERRFVANNKLQTYICGISWPNGTARVCDIFPF